MIRPLDPLADRAAVEALLARAADYLALESGGADPFDAARAFFEDAPPHNAGLLRLGIEGSAGLDGIAELAFGIPQANDAFLGLLLLAPEARGRGLGRIALARVEAEARARGAARLLVAVLDANPRGRAFWEREGFAAVARVEGRRFGARVHDVTRMARALGTAGSASGS